MSQKVLCLAKVAWEANKTRVKTLEQELKELKKEPEELRKEIKELRKDPEELRKKLAD